MFTQKTMFFLSLILLIYLGCSQAPNLNSKIDSNELLVAPDKDESSDSIPFTYFVPAKDGGWYYQFDKDLEKIVGLEISNVGINEIIPFKSKSWSGPNRDFHFFFNNRARQDIYLLITDVVSKNPKEHLESLFMFFPRTYLPTMSAEDNNNKDKKIKMTLPTGEEVYFNLSTHEIIDGALEEYGMIDLNIDKSLQNFPRVRYNGKGVMIRVNKRGDDPRHDEMAVISKRSLKCRVQTKDLWAQTGQFRFRFARDDDFDFYLKRRCGFGIY